MTTQTQTTEERLSKLEGAYEQVNERLGDLTQGQAALRAETNERFNELAQAVREGDAALREQIRQVETNLREEMRQGDAALRAEIGDVRREVGSLRSEMHAAFQRQTYLIIGSLGAMWASMVGGFIALFLSM